MKSVKTYLPMLAAYDYVAFRSPHPDEATVNEVLKELHEKNIDASRLLEWTAGHC